METAQGGCVGGVCVCVCVRPCGQDRHARNRRRTAAHTPSRSKGPRWGEDVLQRLGRSPPPAELSKDARGASLQARGCGTETPGQGLGRTQGWPPHHSAEPLGSLLGHVTRGSGDRPPRFAVVLDIGLGQAAAAASWPWARAHTLVRWAWSPRLGGQEQACFSLSLDSPSHSPRGPR